MAANDAGNPPLGWRRTTFDEFCTSYKGGTPFAKLEYATAGIPVLAKGDIKPFGRLEHSGTRFVDPKFAREEGFYLTKPGDFLMTTRDLTQDGNVLGLMAPVPPERRYLVNQGANVVTFKSSVDWCFLTYWTNSPQYRAHMEAHAVGSTQRHIRKEAFIQAPLLLPPLREQRRIGRVLAALDDKIELSREKNKTLEATIKAVFESWFINFSPVRGALSANNDINVEATTGAFQKVLVDSELGLIPKGWKVGNLGDVAEQVRVGISPAEISPEMPYIGLEHMPQRSIALGEWGNARDVTSQKAFFQKDDILFGKLRPYFHKVGVAPLDGVCSTDIVVVRPKKDFFGFSLCHLSSDRFVAFTNAGSDGTKMPRTSWGRMADYQIVIPSPAASASFDKFVRAPVARIHSNLAEMRALAELRDALLPRLMSGELRTSAANEGS